MKIKIFVTGSEGYVGTLVLNQLNIINKLYYMNNSDIELIIDHIPLVSSIEISKYIKIEYDFVFHCAVLGGRSYEIDSKLIYNENIKIFKNILKLNFDKLIHFTSGADLDRSKKIFNCLPEEVIKRNPIDYFGKSKNEISKFIIKNKIGLNIRVFNVFGHPFKVRNQFIDYVIKSAKSNNEIVIEKDRFFDFFFIEDIRIVIHNIFNDNLDSDFNLCYKEKFTISEVADMIIKKLNSKSNLKISDNFLPYTGKNSSKILEIESASFIKGLDSFINNNFNNEWF